MGEDARKVHQATDKVLNGTTCTPQGPAGTWVGRRQVTSGVVLSYMSYGGCVSRKWFGIINRYLPPSLI